MLYVTPGKFRTSATGVDLTGVTDVEIASILETAGDMVNGYCAAPHGHDFRGGTVVDEMNSWDMGGHYVPGHRQVYPLHRPLKAVTSLRIEVTPSQHLTFNTDELHLSKDRAEVASMSLTSYGLFGAAIIPNIGIQKPQYRMAYTYGYAFPVARERLYLETGKIFRSQNQWWDEDEDIDVVVWVDGVEADEADYTIDYDEGTVTLTGTVTATTKVEASYVHRLPSNIARAATIIAATEFGERNMTKKGLSGLIELAVGDVRIRRDFPRAGVQTSGISDRAAELLDGYRFLSVRGT